MARDKQIESTVEKSLALLEEERVKTLKMVKKRSMIAFGLMFLFLYFQNSIMFTLLPDGAIRTFYSIFSIPYAFHVTLALLWVAGTIIFAVVTRNRFEAKYKSVFVTPLMAKLYSKLMYEPKGFVDKEIFEKSNMYANFNGYTGDDYFKGKIGDTDIEFSEICVTKRSVSNAHSSTSTSSSDKTIFQGIFTAMKLGKVHVPSPIRITTNRKVLYDKTPPLLMKFLEKFLPDYGPVVLTGNEEFDSVLSVHCEDEAIVKKVITKEVIQSLFLMCEMVTELREEKFKSNSFMGISVSMNASNLYLSFSDVKLFTVAFFSSVLNDKEKIMNYINFLDSLREFSLKISVDK